MDINQAIKEKNIDFISKFIKEYDLKIVDGRLVPNGNTSVIKEMVVFWNQRQQARKILLNSLYGALLNAALRFSDERMGQSTTLTGRKITQHMNAAINMQITGEYDYKGSGIVYSDTDSLQEDSIINTNYGNMRIDEAFYNCSTKYNVGDKEYSYDDNLMVMSYNPETGDAELMPISYIYRHKVSKSRWEVEDEFGNKVIITEDHSLMVERNGILLEVKPIDILPDDILITLVTNNQVVRGKIKSIKKINDFDNEYVYDVGINGDTPYFFGNNILVHNSSYFSVHGHEPIISREQVIERYDEIANKTNETFPAFMNYTFNCSLEKGSIIKAGRELIASKGLFIKKKKYAVLIFDLEGTRQDTNGEHGKLKAMGLDLKRADTPKYMQEFLKEILMDILTREESDSTEGYILDKISKFRTEFRKMKHWDMGSPKKVSKLSFYKDVKSKLENNTIDKAAFRVKGKKPPIPGHVAASINWNKLLELVDDRQSMKILDGSRIVVCKLVPNSLNMTSVAYPMDEPHLAEWFKELPFDINAMEEVIIDKKIRNLLGVMNWDLHKTKENELIDLLDF